jgi:predicted alpha/beta hydrolase
MQEVAISALDGYPLGLSRFPAAGSGEGVVIIAGATGVAQRFYRRFAETAAKRGLETWTFDYRGVGRSAPSSLKYFRMSYFDWAELDLSAVIEHVADIHRAPVLLVGHSYGGHAIGLLPRTAQLEKVVTFGTGAGWDGWMPPLERLRVKLLWNVIGPLLVRSTGYLAWKRLGLGEDLPRDLFLQWRRWCQWPRYFFDDPALPALAERFAQVTTPIRAVNATDDAWAMPASRDAFMAAYKNAPVDLETVNPRDWNLKKIGHIGYFRPEAAALWEPNLRWLIDGRQNVSAAAIPVTVNTNAAQNT